MRLDASTAPAPRGDVHRWRPAERPAVPAVRSVLGVTSFAARSVDRPPPLDRRRAPVGVTLRATLWRLRFLVVAICLATVTASVVDALRPAPPATVSVVVA